MTWFSLFVICFFHLSDTNMQQGAHATTHSRVVVFSQRHEDEPGSVDKAAGFLGVDSDWCRRVMEPYVRVLMAGL
jgi:hypothetical protein